MATVNGKSASMADRRRAEIAWRKDPSLGIIQVAEIGKCHHETARRWLEDWQNGDLELAKQQSAELYRLTVPQEDLIEAKRQADDWLARCKELESKLEIGLLDGRETRIAQEKHLQMMRREWQRLSGVETVLAARDALAKRAAVALADQQGGRGDDTSEAGALVEV